MRGLFVVAAAIVSLAGSAGTASAASVIVVSGQTMTPPASAWFGANVAEGPTSFNDVFTFDIRSSSGIANSQITTLLLNGSQNIDFHSIVLDATYAFTKTSSDGAPETWALMDPVFLDVGLHSIAVTGQLLGTNGSYAGTFNIAAVPEPATWAMMLMGFGAIGFVMRNRRAKPNCSLGLSS